MVGDSVKVSPPGGAGSLTRICRKCCGSTSLLWDCGYTHGVTRGASVFWVSPWLQKFQVGSSSATTSAMVTTVAESSSARVASSSPSVRRTVTVKVSLSSSTLSATVGISSRVALSPAAIVNSLSSSSGIVKSVSGSAVPALMR